MSISENSCTAGAGCDAATPVAAFTGGDSPSRRSWDENNPRVASGFSTPACADLHEFQCWIKSWLPELFPHFGAVFGIVVKATLGVKIATSAAIDMPASYLQRVAYNQGIGCPVLSNWLFVRKPQFFSVAGHRGQGARRGQQGHDSELIELFVEHGLRNVFLHGHVDVGRDLASFFALFNLRDAFRVEDDTCAEQVALRVHRALVALHELPLADNTGMNPVSLTPAEEQVHRWLCEGKTNWEISRILNKSEWTVKTQVQRILQKLNAPSRHHVMVATRREQLPHQKQNASSKQRGVVSEA